MKHDQLRHDEKWERDEAAESYGIIGLKLWCSYILPGFKRSQFIFIFYLFGMGDYK